MVQWCGGSDGAEVRLAGRFSSSRLTGMVGGEASCKTVSAYTGPWMWRVESSVTGVPSLCSPQTQCWPEGDGSRGDSADSGGGAESDSVIR